MLENVKKCKNFLATLIKLASSGPQAPEMGQNVKNLVQNLLVRLFFFKAVPVICILFLTLTCKPVPFLSAFFFLAAKELDLWQNTSEPLKSYVITLILAGSHTLFSPLHSHFISCTQVSDDRRH